MLKVIEYDGNLKEIAQKLNNRKEEISIEVNNAVNDIINDIRKNGNQALINYCRKFDGYQIKDENDFVVSNQEKEEALKQVDQDYIRILERTKQQITEFHKNQIDKSWSLYKENGVMIIRNSFPQLVDVDNLQAVHFGNIDQWLEVRG